MFSPDLRWADSTHLNSTMEVDTRMTSGIVKGLGTEGECATVEYFAREGLMRLPVLVSMVFAAIVGSSLALAEEDSIGQKLTVAKDDFEKAAERARSELIADLKIKADAAQKAGDLKALEMLQAELKAFEGSGQLPKSVPVKSYESQLRTARAKLEMAYELAVKLYTKDGEIALAKVAQRELDEFKKAGSVGASTPADPFKVKSVWVDNEARQVLTVTERKGEKFTATFQIGDRFERVVTGTIKDGKLNWLSKDVRVVRGGPGGDNHGTLSSDKIGDKIDFVWRGDNGGSGTFTLRLRQVK